MSKIVSHYSEMLAKLESDLRCLDASILGMEGEHVGDSERALRRLKKMRFDIEVEINFVKQRVKEKGRVKNG